MLLKMEGTTPMASGRSTMSKPPGILDSPTLARVERAMLRHEEGSNREIVHLQRAAYTQSLLPPNLGKDSVHAIKRGLLWQQRDKLFSRWKERYFILTRDYLHCFRRASGSDRISDMGQFLFKVKLVDVDRVEWENKKTYSTVALVLGRDGKIFLRASDGLEDWFELLEECTVTSKERRKALRYSNDGKKNNNNINVTLDEWLAAHHKSTIGRSKNENVEIRQQSTRRRDWVTQAEDWENSPLDNRLSLLTDIDINSYDDSTLEAPSVTSYRMTNDVLCVQPPSLRATGSFRCGKNKVNNLKPDNVRTTPKESPPVMKFRERSYSDIQRVDRRQWRALANPRAFE